PSRGLLPVRHPGRIRQRRSPEYLGREPVRSDQGRNSRPEPQPVSPRYRLLASFCSAPEAALRAASSQRALPFVARMEPKPLWRFGSMREGLAVWSESRIADHSAKALWPSIRATSAEASAPRGKDLLDLIHQQMRHSGPPQFGEVFEHAHFPGFVAYD